MRLVYQQYDERKCAIENNEYPIAEKMGQCQIINDIFSVYCLYLNDGCHNKLFFFSKLKLFNSLYLYDLL